MKTKKLKIAVVEWIDSCIINEQTDDLPSIEPILSVGWLAENTRKQVVLVRDEHTGHEAFNFRASIAIPKCSILKMKIIHG